MNKDLLLSLLSKTIKVDRGGPESREGKLLAVGSDYFVLFTKDDGVVYYKMQHVKSITVDTKSNLSQEAGPEKVELYQGEDFKSVIKNFRHSWVKVNRGGPEKLEGILNEVDDDYVTIISKQEVIQLAMFHIRNISFGAISEEEGDNEASNSKNNSNSKSSGNRRR